MKKLFIAFLILIMAAPVFGQSTKSQLQTEINTNLPSNGHGTITASVMRSTLIDMVNSWVDLNGSSSFSCPAGQSVAAFSSLSTPVCVSTNTGISPVSFGAVCDGVTDDTVALQSWASSVIANGSYTIPNSSCLFKSPLIFSNTNNVTLQGAGRQSQLLYAGATTTGTIVTIGTSSGSGCVVKGWTIKDFRVMSNTTMTAGVGLFVGHLCDSSIVNLEVGGDLNGNRHWYNGIQFYGGNTIHMRGYNFAASNIAEIISGDASGQFTDMFQSQGEISKSAIGLNIAGRVGGFNIDQTDILLNGTNVQIDQSQQATANAQIFFGPEVDIDATSSGGAGIGLNLIDAGSSSFLIFNGTWLASAQTTGGGQGYCVWIQSTAADWTITFNGTPIRNCQGTAAIQSDSSTAIINFMNPVFDFNRGYGFNQSVSNASAVVSNPYCGTHGQSPSCFNSNVNTVVSTGAAAGGTQGKFTAYGATSGSALMQATSTGALVLANNQGGQNTNFNDGPNGTAFAIGNAAGGTIAASMQAIPAQTGNAPNIVAAGTDTNISLKITPKGTGKFTVQGSAPTLTAGCNGTGQVISGNDTHGTITGQNSASTSCTLTFSGTGYTATPDCTVTGLSSPLTGAITVNTTSIVVNFSSTANYKWSYICLGN